MFFIIFLLCLVCGIRTGNEYTMFVAVLLGIFLGTIGQICWSGSKHQVRSKDNIKNMISETKKQEKYDNDYGIIDYEDK